MGRGVNWDKNEYGGCGKGRNHVKKKDKEKDEYKGDGLGGNRVKNRDK